MATQMSGDFIGIEANGREALVALLKGIDFSVSVTRSVVVGEPPSMIVSAALSAATAIISATSGTCSVDLPTAEIRTETDDEGNLILRCLHSPPHKWDFSGKRQI